jgi:hypothetical protein
MENPSVLTDKNSMINKVTKVFEEDIIPKVNQENCTSMIRKNHTTRPLYQHPNHKSQYINQSVYQFSTLTGTKTKLELYSEEY